MAKEISKEELKIWLDEVIASASIGDTWKLNEYSRQAYQQICKKIEESEEWEEIKIQEYEKGLRDAKPKVSKEFVEKWVEIIRPETPTTIRIAIKEMFQEAGVEVEK